MTFFPLDKDKNGKMTRKRERRFNDDNQKKTPIGSDGRCWLPPHSSTLRGKNKPKSIACAIKENGTYFFTLFRSLFQVCDPITNKCVASPFIAPFSVAPYRRVRFIHDKKSIVKMLSRPRFALADNSLYSADDMMAIVR